MGAAAFLSYNGWFSCLAIGEAFGDHCKPIQNYRELLAPVGFPNDYIDHGYEMASYERPWWNGPTRYPENQEARCFAVLLFGEIMWGGE